MDSAAEGIQYYLSSLVPQATIGAELLGSHAILGVWNDKWKAEDFAPRGFFCLTVWLLSSMNTFTMRTLRGAGHWGMRHYACHLEQERVCRPVVENSLAASRAIPSVTASPFQDISGCS
jgi:hypothetical protein